ncbi:copper chaperone PCu(A)C [Nocardia flavorosea]|uniref:Copper chaperone PCu(A)C n=1 Tax=Nocardia flavorosea TaxID=53429 RepID=A0A846YKQ5_9NOCA|nr:copper chaperone PCu(A)C [Nocardia flavorosea]NKY57489.1 copper chaperone PCu(A)C [Nocardia flavorosea]
MQISIRRGAFVAALSFAAVLAGACSSDTAESADRQADSVIVHEQWVKAADSGMTSAFAEFRNSADTEVRVVAASSPAAGWSELHEIAPGDSGAPVMRPKAGGFVIPAGGIYTLAAGGDHLMLMDLLAPLTPGAETEITLEFEDRSTKTFTAQVRDFAGAQENYQPGGGDHAGAPAAPSAPAHGG